MESPKETAQEPEIVEAAKLARADLKRARAIQDLLRLDGWKHIEEILNNHISRRTAELFEPTPAGGRDAEQHNKGAIWGLIYARDLPRAIVTAMEEEVKQRHSTS